METSAGEGDGVANHVIVTSLEARGKGKFIPDGEPVTVLFVNALTTDLDFDALDEEVANEVDPTEKGGRNSGFDTGKSDL